MILPQLKLYIILITLSMLLNVLLPLLQGTFLDGTHRNRSCLSEKIKKPKSEFIFLDLSRCAIDKI